MLTWRALRVFDGPSGDEWGDLGDLVERAPANLDDATITDGRISQWPGFLIAASGKAADWNNEEVDWSGFEEALAAVRGKV